MSREAPETGRESNSHDEPAEVADEMDISSALVETAEAETHAERNPKRHKEI